MTCGACDGGTGQGMTLCARCTEGLETDLREVGSMVEALWASAARLDVGTGSVGSSGHSAPMEPTNSRAYDAGRTLNTILTGWTNILGNRQPHAVKAAALLLDRIRDVRAQVWAPDLKQELHDSLADCRAAMDRTAPRISLGRCHECPGEVIAVVGETLGYCRVCETPRDVIAYQTQMIAAAWDVRGTLPEILRALKAHGSMNIPLERAKKWVQRGDLIPGPDGLHSPASIRAHFLTTRHGQKVG